MTKEELRAELKKFKDAGYEVNDVRTEEKMAAELVRLNALQLSTVGDDTTEDDTESASTGTTEPDTTPTEPTVTETEPAEVKEEVVVDVFRGAAVTRIENRVQNGRVYKQVSTVTATYLVTPDEYAKEVAKK